MGPKSSVTTVPGPCMGPKTPVATVPGTCTGTGYPAGQLDGPGAGRSSTDPEIRIRSSSIARTRSQWT